MLRRRPVRKPGGLAAAGAVSQHGLEGRLDGADEAVLVGKFRIVVVHQHRGIDLEDNEIPISVEPAVDAEIIQPDSHRDTQLIEVRCALTARPCYL